MNQEDVLTILIALAAAIVAWAVLAPYGLVAQVAGALVAFVVVGRAVA